MKIELARAHLGPSGLDRRPQTQSDRGAPHPAIPASAASELFQRLDVDFLEIALDLFDIRVAADLDLQENLQSAGLAVNTGKAEAPDQLSLTGSIAGVAETGTLILASSPDHPSSLNFLPDNHIVILRADVIVGSYEDAWDHIAEFYELDR